MNVREYIESGILEAYVLGALAEAERAEVTANIALYPELKAEVTAIEEAMLLYAQHNAEEAPAFMKDKIWAALGEGGKKEESVAPKVIPFTPQKSGGGQWQRAAAIVVLMGSLLMNYMLWNQKGKTNNEQIAMQQKLDTMQQRMSALAEAVQKQHDMMAEPGMQTVVMQSMLPGHPMAATVYWSKEKGNAYLSMQKMPMPPKGMQYQMWVIQDGKPVSMGVLASNTITEQGMQKLPMDVKAGQAFAISLEKEGGNPTPTQVYVLGKVS